jgi:hypothetical protein
MTINKFYSKLLESKVFKDWKAENKDDYLVNFFKFFESNGEAPWQIGYYNSTTELMTTFVMEEEEIIINPASEVFKKDDTIDELDLSIVKVDFKDALNTAKKFQEEGHSGEKPVKIVILLQNKNENTYYNITYITSTLKTLNMKISATEEIKIIDTKLTNLMDFRQ